GASIPPPGRKEELGGHQVIHYKTSLLFASWYLSVCCPAPTVSIHCPALSPCAILSIYVQNASDLSIGPRLLRGSSDQDICAPLFNRHRASRTSTRLASTGLRLRRRDERAHAARRLGGSTSACRLDPGGP